MKFRLSPNPSINCWVISVRDQIIGPTCWYYLPRANCVHSDEECRDSDVVFLFADDDVTSELQLWLPQRSVMMEDLWCVAVGVFQVWMFVVVFLIMLPAMFGLSLGVTGVYIQILVKILEVTDTGLNCMSPGELLI